MDKDVVEWDKAEDKAEGGADKVGAPWAAPWRPGLPDNASAQTADRRNHTNVACRASSENARSAAPP